MLPNTQVIILTMSTKLPPILLLHGALGSQEQLMPLHRELEDSFQVHCINFSGHGGSVLTQPFSPDLFVNEIIQYADQNHWSQFYIFGYSMGGYMALYSALLFPERVKKIVTLGTKCIWNPTVAQQEIQKVNADKIIEKVPAFAEMLKQRHAPNDWRLLLQHTAQLLELLGQNPPLTDTTFSQIAVPVTLLSGDNDEMVSAVETQQVAHWIPHGTAQILPATRHAIEKIDPHFLASYIKNLLP